MMLSERKNRYQVNHCIVQCKPSKILPNNRRDKEIGVSVNSGFPKPCSFAEFSCILANPNGGTCNITGLLCSCLNVFFVVNPPILLPLFLCFSYKTLLFLCHFVHFSVCWFAILRTIYNGFYLVDTWHSFMFGIVPQRHQKCRKIEVSLC